MTQQKHKSFLSCHLLILLILVLFYENKVFAVWNYCYDLEAKKVDSELIESGIKCFEAKQSTWFDFLVVDRFRVAKIDWNGFKSARDALENQKINVIGPLKTYDHLYLLNFKSPSQILSSKGLAPKSKLRKNDLKYGPYYGGKNESYFWAEPIEKVYYTDWIPSIPHMVRIGNTLKFVTPKAWTKVLQKPVDFQRAKNEKDTIAYTGYWFVYQYEINGAQGAERNYYPSPEKIAIPGVDFGRGHTIMRYRVVMLMRPIPRMYAQRGRLRSPEFPFDTTAWESVVATEVAGYGQWRTFKKGNALDKKPL